MRKDRGLTERHGVMRELDKGIRKWKYFYLFFLTIMEVMALLFPILLQMVVEIIQQSDGATAEMGRMFLWGGLVLGFIVLMTVFHIVAEWFLAKYANLYAANYRQTLFNKFQRVSTETIEEFGQTKVVPHVLNDSAWIREYRRRILNAAIFIPFTIFGSIIMMFLLSWQYSLLALAGIPFVILFYYFNWRKMNHVAPLNAAATDAFFLNIKEGITGARDIRILGKAEERAAEFEELTKQKRHLPENSDRRVAYSQSFNAILFTIITIVIIIFGVHVNMRVAHDLVILNTVLQYVVRIQTGSHTLFVWFVAHLPRYILTKRRMKTVLDLPEVNDSGGLRVVPNLAEPRLEFSNVDWTYAGGRKGLHLNLSIPFNHRVAVAGGKGSRKSNIWKLLLREHEINNGHIAINGIDISSVNRSVLRRQMFSYCDAHATMITGTIRDNMRVLSPSITDEQIMEVFDELGATEFTAKFKPNFLDYVIDPRKSLTDGTRNLLNLARSVLKPASIYIFDQCFEHIAPEYLYKFMAMIKRRRMTCLLITFHPIICKGCNKVYVLQRGKITGEGKHAQLLLKDREYKKFYASSLGRMIQEEEELSNLEQAIDVEEQDGGVLSEVTV